MLSAAWVVEQASANLEQFLPVSAADAVGRRAEEVLGDDVMHAIRGQLQISGDEASGHRLFDIAAGSRQIDIALCRRAGSLVIEGEPARPDDAGVAATAQPLFMRLRMLRPGSALFTQVVRQVRALSGFDRVVLCRVLPEGGGEVIAEARRAGLPAFRGLRLRASDMPACAVFERGPSRGISDVDAPMVPIVDPSGQSADLGLSTLQAVLPAELDGLRRLGARAAMSISIMSGGRLWGLIACLNQMPYRPSLRCRTTLEFLGQIVGLIVEAEMRSTDTADLAADLTAVQTLVRETLKTTRDGKAAMEEIVLRLGHMEQLLGHR